MPNKGVMGQCVKVLRERVKGGVEVFKSVVWCTKCAVVLCERRCRNESYCGSMSKVRMKAVAVCEK